MMIDMDHVSGLIRAAVEAKILPRFRNLAAGEVAQKGPNDPVTIADIEAEEMLSRLLLEAYPGTLVVGEELVSREPAALDALLGDTPVWVIDPVDGTTELRRGQPGVRDDPGLCRRWRDQGRLDSRPDQQRHGHGPARRRCLVRWQRLEVDKATPLNQSVGSAYWTPENWLCPIRG